MKIMTFDIETSGQNKRAREYASTQPSKVKPPVFPTQEEVLAKVKPAKLIDVTTLKAPANIKDEAKKQAKLDEKIEKATASNKEEIDNFLQRREDAINALEAKIKLQTAEYEEKVKKEQWKILDKTALYFYTGAQIISVAFEKIDTGEKKCFAGLNEKQLLIEIGDYLHANQNYILAGQNSDNFDKPFALFCFMRHNLGVPTQLRNGSEFNPVTDIQKMGSFSAANSQTTSLDKMCYGLGIEGKIGNGSDVADLHRNWLIDVVAGKKNSQAKRDLIDYNIKDNDINSEIFRRFYKNYTPSVKVDDGFEDKINNL